MRWRNKMSNYGWDSLLDPNVFVGRVDHEQISKGGMFCLSGMKLPTSIILLPMHVWWLDCFLNSYGMAYIEQKEPPYFLDVYPSKQMGWQTYMIIYDLSLARLQQDAELPDRAMERDIYDQGYCTPWRVFPTIIPLTVIIWDTICPCPIPRKTGWWIFLNRYP